MGPLAARAVSRAALLSALAVAVALGAACSGASSGAGTPTPTPNCTGTPFPDTSLGTLETAIIGPTCALSGSCHLGATSIILGFDLSSAGATHASTVGVSTTAYFYLGQQESFNGAPLPIVATNGSTNGSYLYRKITGAPGIFGSPMPFTGQALCPNQVAAIGAWISGGAQP